MNRVPFSPPIAPTWRDTLAVGTPPRPRNRTGRRRLVVRTLRHWTGLGALAAALVFGYIAWRAWSVNPAALAAPAPSAILREISVRGDGVLGLAWVERTLDVKIGAPLMSLDLEELRERLLHTGQVRVAVVSRRFPDVLAVTLEERHPVLRVRARAEDGEERALFVARDGRVYSGEGYAEETIAALPWLDGVTLARNLSGRGFAPVRGMDAVADLLGTARASAPALAREFQVISLARFERDGAVLVRMAAVPEIVFGARDDFYRQLARLDYILEEVETRKTGLGPVRRIDLAIGNRQVPVTFDAPPAAALRGAPRSSAVATPAAGLVFFRP